MKVGCHVSIAGGVSTAVKQAVELGNTAFAMFLKSSRGWSSKPYPEEEIQNFKALCKHHNFNPKTDILPHGSFLINLGNPDEEKRLKSYHAFLDELKRCEQLDIALYNLHPGSSLGQDKEKSIKYIADAVNDAHKQTEYVKVVLENMAGDPTRIVGAELEDLKKIIDLVDQKDRVGVCIDTCHTFAAGHDLSTEKGFTKFWETFDSVIGNKYLSAIHVNDSMWPYDSRRDQHAQVGHGFMGPEAFRLLMNKPELQMIPKVLETTNFEEEIPQLRWFVGKTKEEVEEGCKHLVAKGASMRATNLMKTTEKRGKLEKRKSKDDQSVSSFFQVKKPKKELKDELKEEPKSELKEDTTEESKEAQPELKE